MRQNIGAFRRNFLPLLNTTLCKKKKKSFLLIIYSQVSMKMFHTTINWGERNVGKGRKREREKSTGPSNNSKAIGSSDLLADVPLSQLI